MGVLSKSIAAILLCGTATNCVPTFDDDLPLIQKPTLLAIQSEPAEAAPGKPVQLTALVGTPDLDASPPALVWGLCTARKPLTELGPVNPICIQPPNQAPDDIVALGSGATVNATLPTDACRLFGPSLPEPMNGEPAGRPVDPDPTGGFYQPIGVTLADTGVTSLGAVRIFCPPSGLDQEQAAAFNGQYRNNQSPRIDSIVLSDDSGIAEPVLEEPAMRTVAVKQVVHVQLAWAACPVSAVCGDGICGAGEDKNGCAEDCTTPVGCTGAESYAWFNADTRAVETKHESIRVSWFATAGRFSDAVTGRDESEFTPLTSDNAWTAPASAGTVRIWLVIRDARGGQSFRSFLIAVH